MKCRYIVMTFIIDIVIYEFMIRILKALTFVHLVGYISGENLTGLGLSLSYETMWLESNIIYSRQF